MEIKLLKQLCEAPGLPGAEDPVREIAISNLKEALDHHLEYGQ